MTKKQKKLDENEEAIEQLISAGFTEKEIASLLKTQLEEGEVIHTDFKAKKVTKREESKDDKINRFKKALTGSNKKDLKEGERMDAFGNAMNNVYADGKGENRGYKPWHKKNHGRLRSTLAGMLKHTAMGAGVGTAVAAAGGGKDAATLAAFGAGAQHLFAMKDVVKKYKNNRRLQKAGQPLSEKERIPSPVEAAARLILEGKKTQVDEMHDGRTAKPWHKRGPIGRWLAKRAMKKSEKNTNLRTKEIVHQAKTEKAMSDAWKTHHEIKSGKSSESNSEKPKRVNLNTSSAKNLDSEDAIKKYWSNHSKARSAIKREISSRKK